MLEYSMLYPENTETRTAIRLDGMWKFRIDWDGKGSSKDRKKGFRDMR